MENSKMTNGHLLYHKQSFDWNDINIDRSNSLEDFLIAVRFAKENGDKVYNNVEIFNFVFSWGSFNDIILRRVKEGWLQPHLQFLIEFLKYNPCKELTDFNSEFKDFNHGEIGLLYAGCPDHLVYNNSSWEKFHQRYVATFSFEERCNKFDYFKNFYIPNLRVDINQIEQLIKNNKVHNSIIRIDPPEIAYEKIHVHFEDEKVECALNIDGTWKHSPKKNYKIKREAFMFLHDCGFLLPDEYYQ